MKNKITLLIILFSIIHQVKSQEKIKGNKNITTQKTELASFKKISVKNNFKVILQKSESSSIEIKTDENIHEVIDVDVMNETLTISTSKKIKESKDLLITVFYASSINDIKVADEAEIETLTTLESDSITISLNDYSKANITVKSNSFSFTNDNKSKIKMLSKSKLNIDSKKINLALNESSNSNIIIKSDTLNIIMKGSAKLEAEGSVNYLNSTTIESSNLDGKYLNAKHVIATIKDSSDLTVNASDEIKIQSSDKSKVDVYGNAQIILDKFEGTSRLNKKEL